ncbi:Poly(A) RNA polymerase, mitochondrial [Armadillidium vulgare]|nr:Poly(A) RNA polymerase, mitochondrial [Armadillidium vulgare]
MSEILYLYGCSDPRVRPLVFCVRLWAKEKRLTRKEQPGMWFSNFTMTMLVLFFLMNANSAAVIPPLSALQKLSTILLKSLNLQISTYLCILISICTDSSFTCEGIRYSYTRDLNNLPESSNNQTLEELLLDFFTFYATFNPKNAISLVTGKTFSKTKYTALHIENPLESDLNVGKCVRYEHLECFKDECIKAVSLLSERNNKSSSPDSWGLSSLLNNYNYSVSRRISMPFDVNTVFERKLNENKVSSRQQGISQNLSASNAVKNEPVTITNPTSTNSAANPSSTNKNNSKKERSKRGKRPSFHF